MTNGYYGEIWLVTGNEQFADFDTDAEGLERRFILNVHSIRKNFR